MTQFSLFGAEASEPSVRDVDGLLLAGGRWVRSGGAARLSVLVAERWRAEALADAFGERGLVEDVDDSDVVVAASSGGLGVRTSFRPELVEHAQRWTRGAHQGLPAGFALGATGLRLWTIATGAPDGAGYLLGTRSADDAVHAAAGAQLSRLGVAAASLTRRGPRHEGGGWRVTSVRRLRRLAELLGPAPPGGAGQWPRLPTR